MRVTRRELLRLAGLGAAGAVLGGCGDNDLDIDPGRSHATAILEPDARSFLVALWSARAREYAVEVRAGEEIVHSATATLSDGHGVIDVQGLAPATAYQVSCSADTGARIVHQVRTAPADDDPRPVRLAISADVDPNPEFDTDLLDQLAAASPELFISLGDFPYTDNGPPATTVETYRERHVDLRTARKVRSWMRTCGIRAIYDDHEFRNDWDAMFAAVEASRYSAAMQVWDEFFPVRAASVDVRYRAWRWGQHAECFLLDCRRFRSANAALDDATKTMLGADQLAWLIDGVKRSTATFKLILTSVPLDFGDGTDHWASFRTERTRLFDALVGVPGILFVSADQHWFAAHRHARGIREFQVGPLARGLRSPPGGTGVLFTSARYNAGLVDIDGDSLTFSALGTGGEVFYKETLRSADLTPA